MPKLKWGQIGEKTYETGTDHGVLYPQSNGEYPKGVVWNGLTSVNLTPSGGEPTNLYADNIKYLSIMSAEDFQFTIECLTYPKEWAACNGETEVSPGLIIGQQRRNTFGFSFRSKIGNDTENEDFGFIIHIIYGCTSSPSEKSYETINESPSTVTFSFEATSTPIEISGTGPDGKPLKAVSHLMIDSRTATKDQIKQLEDILYGTDGTGDGEGTIGRLPMPNEVMEIFAVG